MARPLSHPDAVVNDLQAIRRLDWSSPDQFERLTTLLEHPLVGAKVGPRAKTSEKVDALRSILLEVVERIEAEERRSKPRTERSVARAGAALLRLDPDCEGMSLVELRKHIASKWKRKDGGIVTYTTFRQHLETPEVYEPLASAFRELAAENRDIQEEEEEAGGGRQERPALRKAFDRALGEIQRDLPQPGRVANALAKMEVEALKARANRLREGYLKVRNEAEMFEILIKLTELARHDCRAIDAVPAGEWFNSLKLHAYLRRQLERVAMEGIELERIRIIDEEEFQGGRSWEHLHELIELHKSAGARLLLCRKDAISNLRLRFSTHMGLFMIDAGVEPVAVTGELAKAGSIGLARVFLGHTEMIMEFEREYEDLKRVAVDQNREIREMLPIGI